MGRLLNTDWESPKPLKSVSVHAPMVGVAAVMAIGYVLAVFAPNSLLAISLVGFFLFLPLFVKSHCLWWILLLVFSISYTQLRSPSEFKSLFAGLTSDSVLAIEVYDVFQTRREDSFGGLGRILNRDDRVPELHGRSVSFYLSKGDSSAILGKGSIFIARGRLMFLDSNQPSSSFDSYLLSRGVYHKLGRGKVLRILEQSGGLERLRMSWLSHLSGLLRVGEHTEKEQGTVPGSMILGLRSLLNENRVQLYKESGTFHLFAISGLHIAVIAAFSLFLLKRLVRSRTWVFVLSLLAIWSYVWLVGAPVSSTRAGIMASAILFAQIVAKQPSPFNSWGLAFVSVFIWEPHQLSEAGFQLSFSVVAGIFLIGIPLSKAVKSRLFEAADVRIANFWQALPSRVTEYLIICMAAAVTSMPLSISYFNLFSPGGIVLGVLLIQVAGILIILGVVSMAMGLIHPLCSYPFNLPVFWAVDCIEFALQAVMQLPGASQSRHWPHESVGLLLVLCSLSLAWVICFFRQSSGKAPSMLSGVPILLILCFVRFLSLES